MKRFRKMAVFCAVLIYLGFPFLAGVLGLGRDPSGPRIYPELYHTILFGIGYYLKTGTRPLTPIPIPERPWFYGEMNQ